MYAGILYPRRVRKECRSGREGLPASMHLPPDALLPAVWHALRSILPSALPPQPDASLPSPDRLLQLFRLPPDALGGVDITGLTTRALRLRPSKAAPLSQISGDGKFFPHEPADFLAEVHRQAAALYGSRHAFRTGRPSPHLYLCPACAIQGAVTLPHSHLCTPTPPHPSPAVFHFLCLHHPNVLPHPPPLVPGRGGSATPG